MNVELAKPFIKATIDILSMMAMVTPKAGKPFVKKGNIASGDVTGVVGFTGNVNGSISISFEKKCAVQIVKNMLGDDIQDLMQDVKDAVGEITNMVSGQARAGLTEQGYKLQGSTPTVIIGDNHTITHVTSSAVMAIPFTTDNGKFTIEFCFE
ncbi:chemotaxis protein CheX [Maridesulfovibrio ferrireducens]|uniref:Chemotaxis protein CheX n=1 Tax=Maridesulfovibrio ferrireducens TaxID=246191 RepID=A0A1G9KD43_9BACT|nr:chemotaxis protein CheX [Maridesulfovibrio ferrireducens]MBI9110803.1 chemotaxis protein CheX [Maridesulfovibrio ferrireducens]SDL47502.1 chemotaxis protein CheX [Maridesulfovibrio ferrireducens]